MKGDFRPAKDFRYVEVMVIIMKKYLSKIGLIVGCILLCAAITITAAVVAAPPSGYDPDNAVPANAITLDAVNEYIKSVNAQNEQLCKVQLEDVITTITFSRSLSAEELQAYVEAYDIEIVQLQARGYDKHGNRITFFSRTDKGFEETFRMLNELAESDGVELAGVIGMYALTKSTSLGAIQNDSRTLLVDTSADGYSKSNVAVSGSERNAALVTADSSYAFTNSIAWDAEDLGLVYYEVVK